MHICISGFRRLLCGFFTAPLPSPHLFLGDPSVATSWLPVTQQHLSLGCPIVLSALRSWPRPLESVVLPSNSATGAYWTAQQ